MSKVDFLSWDDDIDLDALLGEFTEVVTGIKCQQRRQKGRIKCPFCNRILKTIARFRGHVSKQHTKPHLKGNLVKYFRFHTL
jgi:uncharacterized C2H2 Zn-finger protein